MFVIDKMRLKKYEVPAISRNTNLQRIIVPEGVVVANGVDVVGAHVQPL